MDWHSGLSAALVAVVVVAGALGRERLARLRRSLGRSLVRTGDRVRGSLPTTPQPPGRPIQEIARDAHRLGLRFRCMPERVSFAQLEGNRIAYDRVLVEACLALGVEHLLEVLRPGPELDAERRRVETALAASGLGLGIDDAA
jgi:hypothetical protein